MRATTLFLAVTLLPGALFAKQAPPPAATLSIHEIRYDGKLSDNAARFTGDIDAEATGRGEASALLFEGDVAIFSPKLPTGVRIERDGEQYWLIASRAGRYKFKLDLVAKIKRAEPWNEIAFDGPDTAIASVAAQVNAPGAELHLVSGTLLESEQKDNLARVRGFLGADHAVALRWQSKAGEEHRKELAACETMATAQITPTVIKFTTRLRYEILQGSLARLTIALPATQSLTRLQGEQIRDWQIKSDGDHQLLTVEFIKPVEKSYTLTVFSEQAVDATPFAGQITPPQPLDVARENGALAVSVEDVVADVDSATGLRQVNAEAGQIAAYRYYARPCALALRVRRIEPVVNVDTRVAMKLEETRLLVRQSVRLSVEKAGIYSAELTGLGNFVVTDVRADGLEDWKVAGDKLLISFSKRILRQTMIDVQLELPRKAVAEPVALTPLRFVGATKETAQINVAASPGIQLKTAELTGVREIPVTELKWREPDDALGYAADRPDWKLTLAAERLAPRVLADAFNLVTIGDGLVGGSATIRYVIVNQGVQEFRVKLPAHWKNVEFTGANIRRKDLAGDTWTISLQDKAWGAYTLVVTYDFQFDPHKATLAIGGVHALDVERETGSVAITSAASLQLAEKTASDPLRRIDETELAENDRALIARPTLLAYRYAGDAYDLVVDVTRFEESAVLQAVADRTQCTTVLTDAGQMLTQASFMVKNNAKQYQRFTLPAGAEFWSCFVAGQAVKPERDGDAVLVPLPRGANRDQAVPVEIVYAQKIGSLKSLWPRWLALSAPQTDIQTTYAEWELFVPATHRLSGFGGNMTVARGTTYDLRDAWREFLRFYDALYHETRGLVGLGVALLMFAWLVSAAVRRGWHGALTVLGVMCVVAILAGMMLPALSSSREKSRRTQELNNLKQVGLALAQYSVDRNEQLPATLDDVLGFLNEKSMRDMNGDRFVYLGAGRKWNASTGDVIAYSANDHMGTGRNVLFGDGHVEFRTPATFDEALAHGGGINAPAGQPAAVAVAAGIRPIRIDIPRTGERFVFTKVLNVRDEPLSVRAWAVSLATRNTARGTTQAAAFVTGLVLLWWHWGREKPSSLWLTVALALTFGSVVSLLVSTRLLGTALIVVAPIVALVIVAGLLRRWWKRHGAVHTAPAAGPEMPPVIAAIALMLFAVSSVQAEQTKATGVSVLSANYVGTVHELGAKETTQVARFEATIELTADEPNQSVTLFCNEVAIEQFTATPGNVRLVRDDDGVRVTLAQRGKATVRLKFLVKLTGDVSKRALAFAIPPALSSRLSVTIDEPDAAVEFPSAVSFTSATDKQQTRVEAVVGSGERVELQWTPRVKSAAETAATVFCQNMSAVTIGAGVVNTRSLLQWHVTQGELRQARVRVPVGQRVLRVEGDPVRTWKTSEENGATLLTVELLKGMASTNFVLFVETERVLDAATTEVAVELPHALDTKRETGVVALRAGEELMLTTGATAELQKVDAAEFAQAVQTMSARTNWVETAVSSAYRFLKPEVALKVHVAAQQPQIEAGVRNSFEVGAEQLRLRATVDYLIKRVGVFTLRLAIPAGYRVEEVTAGNLQQWTEKTDGASRVLEITLTQRVTGALRVNVSLIRSLTEVPKTVEVVGVLPLDVTKLTGFVAVAAETGLQVKADSVAGLTEVPAATVGINGALAYKFLAQDNATQPAWKLTVATEAIEPWVRAEVVDWITLSETLVTGRAQVRFEIQNAPVKEFRVKVPASFKNVEITGPNIRRRDQDGETWRVELQSKVIGTYALTVTWDQQWSAKAGAFESPGIEAVGVERETGAIAVIAQPPLQVGEKQASSDLVRVDARELPEWAGRVPEATVLAYRYLRPGYKLALAAKRFDEAQVLQALVDNARLTTVIAEDGQAMTEMSFAVRNNGRQYLEVVLPRGAQVWSAFVGGRAVRPSVRGEKLLLPLERTGGDAPIAVELTYVGAEKFPRGSGTVALESPTVDVPLKNARWELYLPPDYRYGNFAGTMTREIEAAPVVRTFTLSDYSRTEISKKAEQVSRAIGSLSSARSKLERGDLKEANATYNALRESDAYSVQSEEAKILAKDLRQRQAGNFLNYSGGVIAGKGEMVVNGSSTAAKPAQQFASHLDLEAGEKQYDKLQAAQEVAVAKVLPLRVNLPTHGVRQAFTQVLQTEIGKPMTVSFAAANARATGWTGRIALGAGTFAVLWLLVAGTLTRRVH